MAIGTMCRETDYGTVARTSSTLYSVASIVNNLKRKEYVKAERDGKGYVYSPLIAESDYKRKFLSGFVNNYFKNSFKEMVSFFAKDEKISPEDLKDIIREIENSEE